MFFHKNILPRQGIKKKAPDINPVPFHIRLIYQDLAVFCEVFNCSNQPIIENPLKNELRQQVILGLSFNRLKLRDLRAALK